MRLCTTRLSLDLRDVTRAGGQHDQPVETEGDSGGGRHLRQRRQQRLVDRVDRLAAGGADPGLLLEPPALLDRVGQLAERVGQLEAPGVELEPLDDARIARVRPRQRAERRRPVEDERRPRPGQLRFDAIEEHLIEDVVPGGRRADRDARASRRPRAAPSAVSSPVSEKPACSREQLPHGGPRERRGQPERRADRAPRPGRRPRPAPRSRRPAPRAVRSRGTTRAW